jgi:hypothetical protein
LRIWSQQRPLEGGSSRKQRDTQWVSDVERGRHRDHRYPRQHGRTDRAHTATRPDETRIENFEARRSTAYFGNQCNLINGPQLATT